MTSEGLAKRIAFGTLAAVFPIVSLLPPANPKASANRGEM
jgi:hypothetical protein